MGNLHTTPQISVKRSLTLTKNDGSSTKFECSILACHAANCPHLYLSRVHVESIKCRPFILMLILILPLNFSFETNGQEFFRMDYKGSKIHWRFKYISHVIYTITRLIGNTSSPYQAYFGYVFWTMVTMSDVGREHQ